MKRRRITRGLLAVCVALWLGGCVTEQVGGPAVIEKPEVPPASVKVAEGGWVRWVPSVSTMTAAYLPLENPSLVPDALVSASSPRARVVEMHRSVREGALTRMQQVPSIPVRAATRLELSPGGYHLMLIDLKGPLKEGDSIPVVLEFQRSGTLETRLPVMIMMGGQPDEADHQHHHHH